MPTITPATGSLGFTGEEVYFINSADSKLFFTGYAPEAVTTFINAIVEPATGTIFLQGFATSRPIGLIFEGYAPTITISGSSAALPATAELSFTGQAPGVISPHFGDPTTGSLSFDSVAPQAFTQGPTNTTIVPPTVALQATGYAPTRTINPPLIPFTAEMAFTGYAPNPVGGGGGVDTPIYPFFDQLAFTGYAPTALIANEGTPITNTSASTDVESNYQIDDRTGFKVKVKDPMVEEYTGHLVRPESVDKRSEQEFIRSKPEYHPGPIRPEPVGDERFIEDEFGADGVTIDDL